MQLRTKNLSQRLVLGGVSALLCATLPLQAQDRVPVEAVRAINMARTRAVKINGGLQAYRPASCMFATADPDNPCLISNDSDGFIFRFMGGPRLAGEGPAAHPGNGDPDLPGRPRGGGVDLQRATPLIGPPRCSTLGRVTCVLRESG